MGNNDSECDLLLSDPFLYISTTHAVSCCRSLTEEVKIYSRTLAGAVYVWRAICDSDFFLKFFPSVLFSLLGIRLVLCSEVVAQAGLQPQLRRLPRLLIASLAFQYDV